MCNGSNTWGSIGGGSVLTTLGDMLYENATPADTRLVGNTTTTKKFLSQTGTGSISAAPSWATIVGSDLPNPSSSTLGGVESLAATSHQWINTISTSGVPASTQPAFTDLAAGVCTIAQGCTNNGSLGVVAGSMYYADGSKLTSMGAGSAGQVPVSTGSTVGWGNTVGGNFANLITNGDFSNGTTGWTSSGGTFTTVTSGGNFMGVGTANATWDSSAAAQTLTSPAYTIGSGYAGTNGLWRCKVQNPTAATITMGRWDGTTLTDAIAIDPGTTAKYVEIADSFGAAATTTAIRFTSVASNEPLISIADCYIGLNFNLSSLNIITDWVAYTPTFAGLGTPTNISFFSRRNGGNLQVRGFLTSGTSTATPATFTIGYNGSNANVTIDNSKLPNGTTKSNVVGVGGVDFASAASYLAIVQASATTAITLGGNTSAISAINVPNGSGLISSGQSFAVNAEVPIVGWTSSNAVRADNSDYPWTAYTPVFTGFGTVTVSNCFHSRKGTDLLLRCKWTNATSTGVEARISFPGTLVSDSGIATLEQAGFVSRNGGAGTGFYNAVVLREPSVSYVTFGMQGPSNAALAKVTGGTFTGATDVISMEARIPIQGWTENQRTPMLLGTVFSSTGGQAKVESALISSTGVVTADNAWISNCVVTDTSLYTCAMTGWSTMPACQFQTVAADGTVVLPTLVNTSTSTSLVYRMLTLSVAKQATAVDLICKAPR